MSQSSTVTGVCATRSLDDDSEPDDTLPRDDRSPSQETLAEWRAIRMEQDNAYEESLEADKRKVGILDRQHNAAEITHIMHILCIVV